MHRNYKDCHIHIIPLDRIKDEFKRALLTKQSKTYEEICYSPKKLIEAMNNANLEKVAIMSYPSPETHGMGMELVYFVIDYCSEYRDRLYPVGSVHPSMDVKEIIKHLERQYSDIAAIKLHPVHQHFKPNNYREEERGMKSLEVIYEFASDNNLSVLFHTGTSIPPNARVKFGDPLYLDDVANDFPKLNIIMSHGGRPFWMDKAFFIMRRFKNIWLDISGIPPKRLLDYFPRFEIIAERCVYGSDLPSPGVKGLKGNLEEFLSLRIPKDLKEKITVKNFDKVYRI